MPRGKRSRAHDCRSRETGKAGDVKRGLEPAPERAAKTASGAHDHHFQGDAALLRATLQSLADGIVILDADLCIAGFNRRFIELQGYPEHLVQLGAPLEALIRYDAERGALVDPETNEPLAGDPETAVRLFIEGARQFKAHRYERARPDGTFLEVLRHPLPGGGFVTTFADITERKNAERELRASQIRFSRIVEIAQDAIVSVDDDFRIILFNRGAEITFGYRQKEILGKSLDVLMPEAYRGGHDAHLHAFTRSGEDSRRMSDRREISGLRKDGSEFPAEASISRFEIDGKGYFNAVVRDISERKRREQELRQAQKMESLGQLTGGISHDFNNLLLVIQGNLELLGQHCRGDPEQDELIKAAIAAAARGADLTQRLLAFSRMQTLQSESVQLAHIIPDMAELLRRGLGSSFRVDVEVADDLWSCVADANQFENALLNLAINGRDAMPEGGRLVVVAANVAGPEDAGSDMSDPSQDFVVVSVSDAGVGMTPEVVERAFDPFFTTKDAGKGTGLGLSQVYGFVEQSGGRVVIDSRPGRGTTVSMYFRRAEPDSAGQTRAAPAEDHGFAAAPRLPARRAG